MATAAEYRQYAKECMDSAREATSDAVRKEFLSLAKLWMTSAERMDARSALPAPVQPIQINGHAISIMPDDPR